MSGNKIGGQALLSGSPFKSYHWLPSLRPWQLRYTALLAGLSTSGRKDLVVDRLQEELFQRRLPLVGGKVLSIDMGVRNLAFCVLDVKHLNLSQEAWDANGKSKTRLHLIDWKRLNLFTDKAHVNNPVQKTRGQKAPTDTEPSNVEEEDDGDNVKGPSNEVYSPASMAKVAYLLATQLLTYEPTTILIERQRFRSGGAAAIQEWTVRVNMLESMLWAIFETLHHTGNGEGRATHVVFEVHAVSPKRVGSFWFAGKHGTALRAPAWALTETDHRGAGFLPVKGSGDKKDKIAIAESWLDGESDICFTYSTAAEATKAAFLEARRKGTKGKGRAKNEVGKVGEVEASSTPSVSTGEDSKGTASAMPEKLGKLDDLADCLLQATAWITWEENRRKIVEIGAQEELQGRNRASSPSD
ncbi:hypothetical protein LTR28_007433 [Elasticomyces elasticus]|nr:hypothetical protein LTR28_007433 [Elasticomyces elasticus]